MLHVQAEAVLGAIGGGTGGFLSTPFDIVTTRIIASTESRESGAEDTGSQSDGATDLETRASPSPARILRDILEESGPAGLFRGSLQRTLYWAPAVGIFLSSYCFLRQFALTIIN